jgi:predicted RNA binding protein YcfA (HicA-like mRNA interferase family)
MAGSCCGVTSRFWGGIHVGVLANNLLWMCRNSSEQTDADGQPLVKLRDVLRLLRDDGWRLVAVEGSHRQFKHPAQSGRVTVAGHPSAEVPPGTLNGILKKAGLR